MTIVEQEPLSCAETPCGLNHVVLKVRDIDASHTFWTECLGFKHVGTLRSPGGDGTPPPRVRFYSGVRDGKLSHHHIALAEEPALAAADEAGIQALDHVAIAYPTHEAWRRQVDFLTSRRVVVSRRIERGTIHSVMVTDPNGHRVELVCDLPRELWETDIDAALNKRPIVHQ